MDIVMLWIQSNLDYTNLQHVLKFRLAIAVACLATWCYGFYQAQESS